jgi:hypothetical protein
MNLDAVIIVEILRSTSRNVRAPILIPPGDATQRLLACAEVCVIQNKKAWEAT